MNYYYLGATLPSLSLDAKPGISSDEFAALVQEHLSAGDTRAYNELSDVLSKDPTTSFAAKWRNHEVSLRNALVKLRAAALKKDPAEHIRDQDDQDTDADRAVSDAMSKPTPLEREQSLDRYRWALLDQIAGLTPFSSSAILAYALKLKIAERWATLDEEAGRELADKIISAPAAGAKEDISENNDKSE